MCHWASRNQRRLCTRAREILLLGETCMGMFALWKQSDEELGLYLGSKPSSVSCMLRASMRLQVQLADLRGPKTWRSRASGSSSVLSMIQNVLGHSDVPRFSPDLTLQGAQFPCMLWDTVASSNLGDKEGRNVDGTQLVWYPATRRTIPRPL